MWGRLPDRWIYIKTDDPVPLAAVRLDRSKCPRLQFRGISGTTVLPVTTSLKVAPEGPLTLGNVPQLPLVAQNKRTRNILFIVSMKRFRWTCCGWSQ